MTAFTAMGLMFLLWIMGVLLARHNLKVTIATKKERLEARRAYKKVKNENLRKAFGLDKK